MFQKCGHAIMGSCCLNNKNLADRLRFLQNAMGPVPSPFDCFLVNRSLKTLKLRMEEHQKNGLIVAKFLEAHPFVEKVQHLLLESHPQLEPCHYRHLPANLLQSRDQDKLQHVWLGHWYHHSNWAGQ